MALHELGVDLEQEDNAAGFLGVTLDCDGPSSLLEMKQMRLIKRVIEALGLDDGHAKGKHTPAESKPLVKDADGEGVHGGFSYSSVVGIYYIYLAILNPILPMLSIVALGICSAQSTHMSWL